MGFSGNIIDVRDHILQVLLVAGAAVATPTSLPARSGERAGSSINNQASTSSTCNPSTLPTRASQDQRSGQKRSLSFSAVILRVYYRTAYYSPFYFCGLFSSLLIPVLPPRSSLDSPAPSQLPSFPMCLPGSPVFLPGSCFHAPKNLRDFLSLRGSQSANSSLTRLPQLPAAAHRPSSTPRITTTLLPHHAPPVGGR